MAVLAHSGITLMAANIAKILDFVVFHTNLKILTAICFTFQSNEFEMSLRILWRSYAL